MRRPGRENFRSPSICQRCSSAIRRWRCRWSAALGASGLAASRLELEITETVLLQDNRAVLDVLHQIRELGVRISMDDFGTGYSSLSYLRSFPFDKIKIDRSFIAELGKENDCVAIIRAVTRLGRSLGMVTTRRGRGDAGAARHPARGRLHPGAGLSVQPAAAARRDPGDTQKAEAQGEHRRLTVVCDPSTRAAISAAHGRRRHQRLANRIAPAQGPQDADRHLFRRRVHSTLPPNICA